MLTRKNNGHRPEAMRSTLSNADHGRLLFRHELVDARSQDASMTMAFRAADPAMLKAVKPGDRVRFVPDRVNGQFTVTKIEKAR
jgi:Cu/Ag efflux protein CusF